MEETKCLKPYHTWSCFRNFDQLGWLRGALASGRQWKEIRSTIAAKAPKARYAWTQFKPDREALHVLATGLKERRLSLRIGIRASFENAAAAFARVSAGKSGRALLLP